MKLILFLVSFFSLSSAAERHMQLLFPIGQEVDFSDDAVKLSDFIDLKNRSGRICNILPRTISTEFNLPILRIYSEGQIDKDETKLDCESINMLVRIECHQAATILLSISASHSFLSKNMALEFYDKARIRYQNALHHIIAAFKLDCYKTMEKLYQVLIAFTQVEIDATQKQPTRKLDFTTQKIYSRLNEIVSNAEIQNNLQAPSFPLPTDNTRELVKALATHVNKSLQKGYAHLEAGKTLLSNLEDPTLDSLSSIEITFFLAVEHFIAAYYRDSEQGLEEAESALAELEKVHNLKKTTFAKEGQRYALAKIKLEEAKNTGSKIAAGDRSSTSEYSLDKFLRDEATQNKLTASEDSSHKPAAGQKSALKEGADNDPKDEIVLLYIPPRKIEPIPIHNQITPLSLIKSVGRNCKNAGKRSVRAVKYLWNRLPF